MYLMYLLEVKAVAVQKIFLMEPVEEKTIFS